MKKYNEIVELMQDLEKECGFSKKAIEIRDEILDKFTRNFGEPVEDFEYEHGIDLAIFNKLVEHKNNGGSLEIKVEDNPPLILETGKWEIDVAKNGIVAIVKFKGLDRSFVHSVYIEFRDYQKTWWFVKPEKTVLKATNKDLLDTTIECAIGHFTDNGKIKDVEYFEEYLKAKLKEILI